MRALWQRACAVAVVSALVTSLLTMTCLVTSPSAALAAGGQTGVVTGSVLDDTGKPMAGVPVVIASPSGRYSTKTDRAGYFSFLSVDVDTYVVSIEAPGFAPLVQSGITIQGGNTLALGKVSLTRQVRTIGRTATRSSVTSSRPIRRPRRWNWRRSSC